MMDHQFRSKAAKGRIHREYCRRVWRHSTVSVVADAVAAGGPAWAQDEGLIGDLTDVPLEQFLQLDVFSASKFVQKVGEAPSAVTVITAADIRTYGYRSLADILRSMRGLYVSCDHNCSCVGARGLSRPGDYNTRVLLLLDGYRLNDNVYEGALVGSEFNLDVDLIERVEFVPGPGASWRSGVEAQYVGKRDSANGYLVNATLQTRNLLRNPSVALGVYNLMDSEFADPSSSEQYDSLVRSLNSIPQDGRNYRVQPGYRF